MIETTEAIVIALTKHSDKTNILHLYTYAGGRMQYIVYGQKWRILFTPLNILNVTSSHMPGKMPVLQSAALSYTPRRIPQDMQRQCVAMFLAEILHITLQHPMQDESLFIFLKEQVLRLDTEDFIANIHVMFLIEYAEYLGIALDPDKHDNLIAMPQTHLQRQQQLIRLTTYYNEHLSDFRIPRSLDVLSAVFS